MIYPTATELLRNIDITLAEKVEPSIGDLTGRSALATVRHLINFVRVRIEGEGQILSDDIAATQVLLLSIATYYREAGDHDAAERLRAALTEIGARQAPDRYATLDMLAETAGQLHELLHTTLARLQELRAQRGQDGSYQKIRAAIRHHLKVQIEQQGTLVAPAFFGRGPRR